MVAEVDRGLVGYRAALEKSGTVDSLLSNLEKQERVLRGRLEAGEASRGEVNAGRVELGAARLARADAVAKPLAIAVIGALCISVLLSLVATSTAYYVMLSLRERRPVQKPEARG